MDENEIKESSLCVGSESLGKRAERYLKEALGIDGGVRGSNFPHDSVGALIFSWTMDYLAARRRLCKRISSDRSEGASIMRSLRTDPLVPFRAESTYDPIGRRAEVSLAAEVRELAEMERRLRELADAFKRDTERG